ncbi:MAG TPA: hypothetical protein PK781_09450 [Terrimesophilobacter sp.]|nr:hypothetical protein [Terrimesophilobacter sp.]HRQ00672.1 hypothetical protein [Terrimesophilobacter sp.]
MIEFPAVKPAPLASGRAWAACLGALGVIAAGTVGLRLWGEWAWSEYVDVRAEYVATSEAAQEAHEDLTGDLRAAAQALEAAEATLEAGVGFVGEEQLGTLEEERAAFSSVLEESTSAAGWAAVPIPALEDTALLWNVLGESARLGEASVDLADDRAHLTAVATTVRTATNALGIDAVAVINAAGELGVAELSRYPSATNDSYRALKSVAQGAAGLTQLNYRAGDIVADVVAARDAMAASHGEKESAKAGPLNAVRDEVEAFARSIAGGVRIDFTWQDIVIGHGQGTSAAGTATWDTADDGYSSVTLTNSIARHWYQWSGYRNLVAHEVGHSITSKKACYDLYMNGPFGEDNERWATAWAISMGYTVSAANGSDLYGAPTAEQISVASGCR